MKLVPHIESYQRVTGELKEGDIAYDSRTQGWWAVQVLAGDPSDMYDEDIFFRCEAATSRSGSVVYKLARKRP